MRYTYDIYSKAGIRLSTTTNLDEIDITKLYKEEGYIVGYDGLKNRTYKFLDEDELDAWFMVLARNSVWKGKTVASNFNDASLNPVTIDKDHLKWDPFAPHKEIQRDPINPDHYKEVVPGLQYMEMMQYMLPDVSSHLLGQVFKYLCRNGKKDESEQELRKALWYLEFLVAYYANKKRPIRIQDIRSLIDGKIPDRPRG